MSAIAGIVYLNGKIVRASLLEQMAKALIHRGPDRQKQWHERSIGFVQCMLHTTPESLGEYLPFDAEDLVITADARIDNREDLQKQFKSQERYTDSQLIIEAYRRWGVACVGRLIGDFAFAIWDRHRQLLFAARDPLGVKPFHYCYHTGEWFAFASEYRALLRLPFVSRQVNELSIAAYLLRRMQDRQATFYQDVMRLAPGHTLIVTSTGLRLYQYWAPDLEYELSYASDTVYADHFREIFTEAVRCRLHSAFPTGVLMSGGLDSTSIACVARTFIAADQQQELPIFSAVFPSVPRSDERSFIDQVVASGGLQPHFFQADQARTLPDIERMFWHLEVPFPTPNLFLTWELCQQARASGVRVLLDGLDGDTGVSHGFGYLAELALQRRWNGLRTEVTELIQHWDDLPKRAYFYRTYGFPSLTLHARRKHWVALADALVQLSAISGSAPTWLLKEYIVKPLLPTLVQCLWSGLRFHSKDLPAILNPAFARRIAPYLQQQTAEVSDQQIIRNDRDLHARQLQSGLISTALEIVDRTSAAFGVELRHPFFDLRLVEYCLALPGNQKLRQGWTRLILRQAMTNTLPLAIQQRRDKANLGVTFAQVFLTYEQILIEDVLAHPAAVMPYVNLPYFERLYNKVISSAQSTASETMMVWLVVVLNIWLKRENDNGNLD